MFNGRIAGISGVLGGLLRPASLALGDAGWRISFVLGLLAALLVYLLFAAWPAVQVDASYGALVLAGLMVGWAPVTARLHQRPRGVWHCAMSPRSLAATACFMAAGFATVYAVRHLFNV